MKLNILYKGVKGKHIFRMAIYLFTFLPFYLCSCSDWLDVPGENVQKEEDQFDSYKGFRDALTGIYMTMGSTDAYGERMTMTDVDNLADLWYNSSQYESQQPLKFQLYNHNYTGDESRAAIKAMYAQLFTTISSANVLLKNIEDKGNNITDAQARNVIHGEALAIRAYCQFDVLRLFGQLPNGGTTTVSLPYSFTTSIDEMPSYYGFDEYVNLLKTDIEQAETLLKESDPVMKNSFESLNYAGSNVQDDYMYYRQSRLNYWAVRALHARLDLYTGNTTEAHDIAMEIINAKNSDGSNVISLSGISDLQKGYNGLPSECLFYLSKYDVNTYANELLIGGNNTQVRMQHYFISNDQLTQLYSSLPGAAASHNRYLSEWNRTAKNASGNICPTLKKYWYDASSAESSVLSTKYQIIPMIRLSEMYLIAMETSTNLDEVHNLYKTYMDDRGYSLYTPFESLEAARTEIVNEYRREFFGEGQMFYVYKRLHSQKMLWNEKDITEANYILPLPSSEYDPNKK